MADQIFLINLQKLDREDNKWKACSRSTLVACSREDLRKEILQHYTPMREALPRFSVKVREIQVINEFTL
jgi:hypothetical protein